MTEYIREFVGTSKFDDYVDENGNLIIGMSIDCYRTYPKYITAVIVDAPKVEDDDKE